MQIGFNGYILHCVLIFDVVTFIISQGVKYNIAILKEEIIED